MTVIELGNKKIKIMQEINDSTYGRVWKAYYENKKVYVIEGKIVEDKNIIDDLDNKYGIPASERWLVF